ncbi:hypothetical protein FDUTEX481_04772 [Tolypothrix sp. PCC 7601]|nr:hypothetical protein FDUTEX481_04772 [Tolypothrix sp. PCC 7601]
MVIVKLSFYFPLPITYYPFPTFTDMISLQTDMILAICPLCNHQ